MRFVDGPGKKRLQDAIEMIASQHLFPFGTEESNTFAHECLAIDHLSNESVMSVVMRKNIEFTDATRPDALFARAPSSVEALSRLQSRSSEVDASNTARRHLEAYSLRRCPDSKAVSNAKRMSGTMPERLRVCLNCDAHFRGSRKLFCGERCRQIAEWVRYCRRKIAEGTVDRPDIEDAIMSRMGVLITGFYDKRGERAVSKEDRERLRALGKCQRCGTAFEETGEHRFTVQHTRVFDGFALEAWCWQCNVDHAQSVSVELTEDEGKFVSRCFERAQSPAPIRVCDDEIGWPNNWRNHLKINFV